MDVMELPMEASADELWHTTKQRAHTRFFLSAVTIGRQWRAVVTINNCGLSNE
jgi:hypothetical protein